MKRPLTPAARLLALAAVLLVLGACGQRRETAAQVPMPDSLRAQALIDSGNAALRKGEFAEAAKRYASAAVVRPEDPAAFYGLGMALARLGRDDEARVAYAKARELSRGSVDADDVPREIRYRRTTHP
jgi:Flp pilus assembly protein TadD